MKKKLTVELDEEVYQRLLSQCGGDEEAVKSLIAKTLETRLGDSPGGDTKKDSQGLEDYLKKGSSGNRRYGIKGQGW